MELDDLRRQWQQPGPAVEAPLSATQLTGLMQQQRRTLLDKLRRNTYLEIGFSVVTILLFALNRDYHKPLHVVGTALQVGLLGLLLRYYYYRVWRILRQLAENSGAVRGHLTQLCAGLRHLLRLYYRFSIAAVPVTLLVLYGYVLSSSLAGTHLVPREELGLFGIVMLLLGLFLMVLVYFITPWWLQRLYGQHLDRLESQLGELAEEIPA